MRSIVELVNSLTRVGSCISCRIWKKLQGGRSQMNFRPALTMLFMSHAAERMTPEAANKLCLMFAVVLTWGHALPKDREHAKLGPR